MVGARNDKGDGRVHDVSSRAFGDATGERTAKPPAHLSRGAKRWWRSVMQTTRLGPDAVEILTAAAEAWDRKEDARQLIADEGIVVHDDAGLPLTHPAVQIEGQAADRMARLIRALKVERPPAELRSR